MSHDDARGWAVLGPWGALITALHLVLGVGLHGALCPLVAQVEVCISTFNSHIYYVHVRIRALTDGRRETERTPDRYQQPYIYTHTPIALVDCAPRSTEETSLLVLGLACDRYRCRYRYRWQLLC